MVLSGNTFAGFYLSTQNDAALGGTGFENDDIVYYDPVARSTSIVFNGSDFWTSENIDALHILQGGDMVLVISTTTGVTLGGKAFEDGDLVRYNPADDTASLYFGEDDLFDVTEDIDAFSVDPTNGNLIFSTDNAAELVGLSHGDLSFGEGDLVAYDPDNNAAEIIFRENLFGGAMNIDAVHMGLNGNIILSTATAATLPGLSFDEDDLVSYNLDTGQATLLLDGAQEFGLQENIDAIYAPVPIPAAVWLLGCGLISIVGLRMKIRK